MALLLGIDLGTSYFKVGLFDAAGEIKGLGRVAVERDSPAPGRTELPVARFWDLLRRALGDALAQAGRNAAEISAVSYSSQANSFVLLDRRGVALSSIVLWTDTRAKPLSRELKAFSESEAFSRAVGFSGWSSEFAVAKWRWWQDNEPQTWARVAHVLTLADYFTFVLTGQRVGDASTAAFLGLYELRRRAWWPVALAMARLEAAQLSSPVPPGTIVGRTLPCAAYLLGLPAGVQFAVGGLDHHVASLGAGLGKFADVSISTGTVLAAMTLVVDPASRSGCYHGPHFDGSRFYRLAFDPNGAGQLEDYQRRCAADLTLEELIGQAVVAPPAASAPRFDPAMGHGPSMRFLLEKIAASHRALIEQATGGAPVARVVATGGGARSAFWLQLKADMFGVPVVTPASPERACLGAAMLASVAAGWYPDIATAMAAMQSPGRVFSPNATEVDRYRDWRP